MDTILVVNAGSSSVKFQVFATDGRRELTRLIKGQMDGIGTRPRLRATAADGTILLDQTYTAERVVDVPSALALAGDWLRRERKLELAAVGHRVVHGGPNYDQPVMVNPKIIADLERYVSLAPLHQPNNLAPFVPFWRARRACRRSPASTPPFIVGTTHWRTTTPFRTTSMPRACGATAFMACPMNSSQTALGSSRPRSPAAV